MLNHYRLKRLFLNENTRHPGGCFYYWLSLHKIPLIKCKYMNTIEYNEFYLILVNMKTLLSMAATVLFGMYALLRSQAILRRVRRCLKV